MDNDIYTKLDDTICWNYYVVSVDYMYTIFKDYNLALNFAKSNVNIGRVNIYDMIGDTFTLINGDYDVN